MFRRIRHWSSLVAVGGWLSLTASSHAQSASASPNAARVEELLRQGIELRRTGKDAEALAVFRQAADLDPESARVRAQLGVTHQALGRWLSADTYLTEALAQAGDPYIGRHVAALEKALEIVKDHLGSLAVEGGPAGADVSLNGRWIGRLPLSARAVAVGSYLMEVTLEGHYSESRPLSITKRALTRESVELVPYAKGDVAAQPGVSRSSSDVSVALGAPSAAPGEDRFERTFGSWVPWMFGGASAASASVAIVFWAKREEHAKRWNDNSVCRNQVGVPRKTLCGDERDSGEQAQTIAYASGGLSLAFAAGAIWTALAGRSTSEPASAGLEACALGPSGVDCFGRF
jgi:PEGA domain